MQLQPYVSLNWAFQLHYYICFRTRRRRISFISPGLVDEFHRLLIEICRNCDYHLLQCRLYPNHLRCLLSLRPDQSISKVIQTLKPNLTSFFDLAPPVWARGFLAKSVGRTNLAAVRQYSRNQAEHHGYARRIVPPVYRFQAGNPRLLCAAHSVFDLSHHVVIATQCRHGIFDSSTGRALAGYWLRVAEKRGFAIDQMSILPDHAHLSCVLSLMNNGQYFVAGRFPELLVKAGVDGLWQASAYAGTCGQFTTALMKVFLRGGRRDLNESTD
jgi:putative transposase